MMMSRLKTILILLVVVMLFPWDAAKSLAQEHLRPISFWKKSQVPKCRLRN